MAWREKIHASGKLGKSFIKWLALGVIMGAIGGVLGALFHHLLHFVTQVRGANPWLVWLLPVGGLLSIGWYHLLKLQDNRGTNEIIEATLDGGELSPCIAPGIVGAAALTHLFGGSAGREGAALQLGGSAASMLAKALHLPGEERQLMVMAGMSSVFAGLFGTPMTAAVFCMEFESVGTLLSPAVLPCYLAAYVASRVSGALGVHGEGFPMNTAFSLNMGNALQYLLLAVLLSFLGIAMCWVFHKAEHLAAHKLPNPMVRIVAGGLAIALLTWAVGDMRFNGAGMDMALKAVAGESDWYNFLLKLLFTAITLAAGFKGGEIVPTFCIGATFGALAGGLLGLDVGFCASLCLVGLFCCATNSPIASILLSVEMFGGTNLYIYALVCAVCFTLSGNSGLYVSQIIQFGKAAQIGNPRDFT